MWVLHFSLLNLSVLFFVFGDRRIPQSRVAAVLLHLRLTWVHEQYHLLAICFNVRAGLVFAPSVAV